MEIRFSKKDLETIKPLGVDLKLKYETDYLGDEKETTIRVYPLKVEEKIIMQQFYEKLNVLNKKKDKTKEEDKELLDINEKVNLQYVTFTLNKVMPVEEQVDNDFVKQHIPNSWYEKIITAILEAEGHTKKEIEEEKN